MILSQLSIHILHMQGLCHQETWPVTVLEGRLAVRPGMLLKDILLKENCYFDSFTDISSKKVVPLRQ